MKKHAFISNYTASHWEKKKKKPNVCQRVICTLSIQGKQEHGSVVNDWINSFKMLRFCYRIYLMIIFLALAFISIKEICCIF